MSAQSESENDVDLVRRTGAGDRSAFEHLVERHQASVYRFVRTLVRDRAACDDILQDTFLAAWRGANGFRGESSARTWLFTIARHAATRHYRRRSGEPERDDVTTLDDLGAAAGWGSAVTPEAAAIESEERAAIARAMEALDPGDRRVLVLRDLEQMSGEEAAEILGVTLQALKSRLHRARLRFAAELRKEPGYER